MKKSEIHAQVAEQFIQELKNLAAVGSSPEEIDQDKLKELILAISSEQEREDEDKSKVWQDDEGVWHFEFSYNIPRHAYRWTPKTEEGQKMIRELLGKETD